MNIRFFLFSVFLIFMSNAMSQSFINWGASRIPEILSKQYDQSDLFKQESYSKATSEMQLKMIDDYFYRKQDEIFEKLRLISGSSRCRINLGPLKTLPLAILGYKLRHRFGLDRIGDVAIGLGISSVAPQLANAAYQFANEVIDCGAWLTTSYVMPAFPSSVSYYLSFLNDIHEDDDDLVRKITNAERRVEQQNIAYIRIKSQLSQQIQKIIEKYFIAMICHEVDRSKDGSNVLRFGNNPGFGNGQASSQLVDKSNESQESMQFILDIVLNLPQKPKALVFVPADIEEAFSGYRDNIMDFLRKYCIRQVAASKSKTVRKMAAYFWGPPGTGKTRAAGCIAQALKLPFETISLSKITPEDLIGTEEKPGLLLDVMTRAGRNGLESFNNMVLLFDDADRVLNEGSSASSFILNLLEPETKAFYSPFLKSNVDISHLCIILAGNSKIKDEALFSRLQNVEFTGYDSSFKKQVAWKTMIPELLKMHETSELPLSIDEVKSEKMAIDKRIEDDENQGFRGIKQEIMDYLEGMVLRKYFPISTKPESLNLSQS